MDEPLQFEKCFSFSTFVFFDDRKKKSSVASRGRFQPSARTKRRAATARGARSRVFVRHTSSRELRARDARRGGDAVPLEPQHGTRACEPTRALANLAENVLTDSPPPVPTPRERPVVPPRLHRGAPRRPIRRRWVFPTTSCIAGSGRTGACTVVTGTSSRTSARCTISSPRGGSTRSSPSAPAETGT